MSAAISSGSALAAPSRHRNLALLLLAVALFGAYANALRAPFIFDDVPAIPGNPTIRHLWPLSAVLLPQSGGGLTVAGRPILNLSLAFNFAISGSAPWSYHVLNVLIHAGSALLLFGVVRRTTKGRIANADVVAFATATLWSLHPLHTEAVTYTVQRAESLMAFFYLLTLYAFVRSTGDSQETEGPLKWASISVVACLLGMATKEVMVTAPLLVLLFDRTFVGGSFVAAWKQRKPYYLALAGTWLLLAALVLSTGGNRGGTVGLGVGVPLWAYPLTQFQAIARYLGLTLWPSPLVFEYGQFWVQRAADILPYAAIVLLLLVGTVVALWRCPIVGFLGAWFFGILAPTSLAPGTIQMIVEHRTYLPMAALIALLVLIGHGIIGKRATIPTGVAIVMLLSLTVGRNRDYRSETSIWSDTVAKRPANSPAYEALADALQKAGRLDDAIARRREALRLKPDEATFHFNLGATLAQAGQYEEAIKAYAMAEHLRPDLPQVHYAQGIALLQLDRLPDAMAQLQIALRIHPNDSDAQAGLAEVHFKLGNSLARRGDLHGAIAEYEATLKLNPADAEAHHNLGVVHGQLGQYASAQTELETALRLRPDYPDAQHHLEQVKALLGER
jgi:protein O-mannosyl-transferase